MAPTLAQVIDVCHDSRARVHLLLRAVAFALEDFPVGVLLFGAFSFAAFPFGAFLFGTFLFHKESTPLKASDEGRVTP